MMPLIRRYAYLAGLVTLAVISFLIGRWSDRTAEESERPLATSVSREREGSVGRASVARMLTTEDPRERMHSILANPDCLERAVEFASFAKGVDPKDIANLVDAFDVSDEKANGADIFGAEFAMLLQAWVDIDPSAAMKFALDGVNSAKGDVSMRTMMSHWASEDPEAAEKWLSQMDGEAKDVNGRPLRELFAVWMADGIATHDPSWAKKSIESIGDPQLRSRALLETEGQQAALAYIDTLTDLDSKRGALNSIIGQLASRGPEQAKELIHANAELVDASLLRTFLRQSRLQSYLPGAEVILEYQSKQADQGDGMEALTTDAAVHLLGWAKSDYSAALSWFETHRDALSPELQKEGQDLFGPFEKLNRK